MLRASVHLAKATLVTRVVNATVLISLVFWASSMAHAASFAISVTDDRGKVVRFERPPQRIVTLLPSLTESICALDACGRLVGTDRSSNWPMSVAALPKLGGLDDANLEGIAALHPDVVLAGRSSRVIDRLEELGIPVLALEAKTLNDSHRVLSMAALLLGTPGAADRAWQRIDSQIAAATAGVPPRFRGSRVYFEVGESPYAAGASSFIGELLARLGLGNAVPAELGPFPRLNPEFVLRAQPDIIMSSAREVAEMTSRPGWDTLSALRGGRTCGFLAADVDILYRPGPRLGEAADVIVTCLRQLPADGALGVSGH
jgi:iron complex transport system substrate-binding protein